MPVRSPADAAGLPVPDPGARAARALARLGEIAAEADAGAEGSASMARVVALLGEPDAACALAEVRTRHAAALEALLLRLHAHPALRSAVSSLRRVLATAPRRPTTEGTAAQPEAGGSGLVAPRRRASVDRPQIVINLGQERDHLELARDAMRRLARDGTLVVHGGLLSRLRTDRPVPFLDPLTVPAALELAAQSADWMARVKIEGKPCLVHAQVPKRWVEMMLATPDLRLPVIRRLVTSPVFAADGTLVDRAGLHRQAGILARFPPAFRRAWPGPQVGEAALERAKKLLFGQWLADMAFAHASDRAHALAYLLLPLARDLIAGPTPATLFRAPARGAAKTLLASLGMLLHVGEGAAALPFPEGDDKEVRLRLTALLGEAPTIVLFDNVDGTLASASFSALLTTTVWSDRILGVSRMGHFENRTTWVVTGRNPLVSDEIQRRIVYVTLQPKHERPWTRDPTSFQIPKLAAWTTANRALLLSALITLVRWWQGKGCPEGARSLGSFEAWASVMGGILEACGVPGFLDDAAYRDGDLEIRDPVLDLVRLWAARCPDTPMTSRALLAWAAQQDTYADLGLHADFSARKLGNRLNKYLGRVVGPRTIRGVANADNVTTWHLVPLEATGARSASEVTLSPAAASPDLEYRSGLIREQIRRDSSAANAQDGAPPDLPDLDPTPGVCGRGAPDEEGAPEDPDRGASREGGGSDPADPVSRATPSFHADNRTPDLRRICQAAPTDPAGGRTGALSQPAPPLSMPSRGISSPAPCPPMSAVARGGIDLRKGADDADPPPTPEPVDVDESWCGPPDFGPCPACGAPLVEALGEVYCRHCPRRS